LGVITLKLDDTIEGRLRKRAADLYGATRGALSRAVEDALTTWLSSGPSPVEKESRVAYIALRGGRRVLEASSLRELAKLLEKTGTDPRDVEIRSAPEASGIEKLGLRVSHRAA
jgi:hypothetical protein